MAIRRSDSVVPRHARSESANFVGRDGSESTGVAFGGASAQGSDRGSDSHGVCVCVCVCVVYLCAGSS
jgi:hypothetical protein